VLYTFDLSLEQLSAVQDYVRSHDSQLLRIIHVMYDDLSDHYITLVDCEPKTATFLALY
jgi:hypothetical protein